MKKNHGKYEAVEKLPPNAVTVKEYADKAQISTSYIYKQVREKKAKFRLVVFQTINFIIPEDKRISARNKKNGLLLHNGNPIT